MRQSITYWVGVCLAWVVFFGSVQVQAQEAPTQALLSQGVGGQVVPGSRLIQFSGVLKDHMGQPLSGVQGITFSLYKEQSGGAPLWLETQNVTADEQGHYAVLLGATTSDGLPLELFTSGESRWLGVQASLPGEEEQSRVLLVSVPYALKAADAETLGGKPLSAFVLASTPSAAKTAVSSTSLVADKAGLPVAAFRNGISTAAVTGGTPGTLGKFDADGLSLVNSVVSESAGKIGIGTTNPGAKLDVKGSDTGNVLLGELGSVPTYGAIGLANSLAPGSYNFTSSASDTNLYINRPTGKALKFREDNRADQMTILSGGKVGIGTTTPGAKLDVKGSDTGNVLLGELGGVPTYGAIGLANSLATGSYNFTSSADDANLYINRPTGKALKFREDNRADQMTILSGGNVGIGTTGPTQKLDVVGNAKASGDVIGGTRLCIAADCRTSWPSAGVGGSGTSDYIPKFTGSSTLGNSLIFEHLGMHVGIGTTNPTEVLDVAGTVKATAFVGNGSGLTNLPGGGGGGTDITTIVQHHASFQGAFQSVSSGSAVTPADGLVFLRTPITLNAFADIKSHDATTVPLPGLNRTGAFLSLRLKGLAVPASSDQRAYFVAGGADFSGPVYNGFGFKYVGGIGLHGVTILNGTETVVDLTTIVGSLTTDPPVDLLAVRRATSVEFYVNGVLKGTSTTNLPSQAYSIYQLRLVNGSTNQGGQQWAVSYLTVAIPMF